MRFPMNFRTLTSQYSGSRPSASSELVSLMALPFDQGIHGHHPTPRPSCMRSGSGWYQRSGMRGRVHAVGVPSTYHSSLASPYRVEALGSARRGGTHDTSGVHTPQNYVRAFQDTTAAWAHRFFARRLHATPSESLDRLCSRASISPRASHTLRIS
jgi:hypothetical protein